MYLEICPHSIFSIIEQKYVECYIENCFLLILVGDDQKPSLPSLLFELIVTISRDFLELRMNVSSCLGYFRTSGDIG